MNDDWMIYDGDFPGIYGLVMVVDEIERNNKRTEPEIKKHKRQKGTGMNAEYIANMARENITTVHCKFKDTHKTYIFKCKWDIAGQFKTGDLAIVEANNQIHIVEVLKVDEVARFDENIKYKWVIGKVDMDYLNELSDEDDRIIKNIEALRRKKVVEEYARTFGVESLEDLVKVTDGSGNGKSE